MSRVCVLLVLAVMSIEGALAACRQSDHCGCQALGSTLHWQSRDWALAFRLTARNGKSAYENYMNNEIDDDHPAARLFMPPACLQNHGQCDRHYHSSLLKNWPSQYVEEVRVALFKGSQEVAWILFNGINSDKTNWFREDKVIGSSWTDFISYQTFSMVGDYGQSRRSRRFYIWQERRFVPGAVQECRDIGWLYVQDGTDDSFCNVYTSSSYPFIAFSPDPDSPVNAINSKPDSADVMTISVKLNLPCLHTTPSPLALYRPYPSD